MLAHAHMLGIEVVALDPVGDDSPICGFLFAHAQLDVGALGQIDAEQGEVDLFVGGEQLDAVELGPVEPLDPNLTSAKIPRPITGEAVPV